MKPIYVLSLLLISGGLIAIVALFRRKRHSVNVRVHQAFFLNSEPDPYYFINVTNLTNKPVTITHVIFGGIDILNPHRPLPVTLNPSQTWKTFIAAGEFINLAFPWNKASVKLSDGTMLRSQKAQNVPQFGHIPGGPVKN